MRLKMPYMGGDQRDKIAQRLNRKATQSMTFKDLGGRFLKIKDKIPIRPKYGLFKGTDTFCWKLETEGHSQTATQTIRLKDDGRIEQIIIDFPSGSEYEFYIMFSIDGAQVFPSELSQQLRGDHKIRTYAVDIPFQRDSRLKVDMITDAGLAANTTKACWTDITVRYRPRL